METTKKILQYFKIHQFPIRSLILNSQFSLLNYNSTFTSYILHLTSYMNQDTQLKLKLELYWIVATILIVVGIMYPIYTALENYFFFWINILFIVVFVTFFRYIFFLKYTLIAYNLRLKLALMFLSLPLLIVLVGNFNDFRNYIDEQGIQSLFEHLSFQENDKLSSYMKNETIFFSVGSIITGVAFPLRMLISVWRQYNGKEKI